MHIIATALVNLLHICLGAGLSTSLVAQVCTQSDAGPDQGQAEQGLQRQPGEIKQRPHAGAIEFHKGILQRGRERRTKKEH